mgnify:FL=1
MICRDGEVLRIGGALTLTTVPDVCPQVALQIEQGAHVLDFSDVTEVDSSAVALALEWQRIAARSGISLRLENLPASMLNLSKLYGVSELVQPN